PLSAASAEYAPGTWPVRERPDFLQLSAVAAISLSRGEHVRAMGDESLRQTTLRNVFQDLHREGMGYPLLRVKGRMGGAAYQGPFSENRVAKHGMEAPQGN